MARSALRRIWIPCLAIGLGLSAVPPGVRGQSTNPIPVTDAASDACIPGAKGPGPEGACSGERSEPGSIASTTFVWGTAGFGASSGMAGVLAGSVQRGPHVLSIRLADTWESGLVDAGLLYGRVVRRGTVQMSISTGVARVWGWRVADTVGVPFEVQAFLRGRRVGIGAYGFANVNPEESMIGAALSLQLGRLPPR